MVIKIEKGFFGRGRSRILQVSTKGQTRKDKNKWQVGKITQGVYRMFITGC